MTRLSNKASLESYYIHSMSEFREILANKICTNDDGKKKKFQLSLSI